MNERLNKLVKGDPIEEGVASTLGSLAGNAARKVVDTGKDFKQGFQAGMTKDQQTQPNPPTQPEQPSGTPPDEDQPKTDQELMKQQPEPSILSKLDGAATTLKQWWNQGGGDIPKDGETYHDDQNRDLKFSNVERGIKSGNPDYFEFDHVDQDDSVKYRLYGTSLKQRTGAPIPVKIKFVYDKSQQPQPEKPTPQERRDPKTGRYIPGNQSGVQFAEAVPPPSPEEMKRYDANKDGKLRSTRNARSPGGEELYRMGHSRIFGDEEPEKEKSDEELAKGKCRIVCNQFRQIVKDFLGVNMPYKVAVYISKDPKNRLLKHMIDVDPDINMTYDAKQVKLRGDQTSGNKVPFGQRRHVAQVKDINEQASSDKIQRFAAKLKIDNVDSKYLNLTAKKWPQFIEAIKQLGWDYNIQYDTSKPTEDPEEAQPGKEPIDSKTGKMFGWLVKVDPNNPASNWKLTDKQPRGVKLAPTQNQKTNVPTTLYEQRMNSIRGLVKGD